MPAALGMLLGACQNISTGPATAVPADAPEAAHVASGVALGACLNISTMNTYWSVELPPPSDGNYRILGQFQKKYVSDYGTLKDCRIMGLVGFWNCTGEGGLIKITFWEISS